MNIKVTAISAGILVALSTAASAQTPTTPTPPSAPSLYASGPEAPLLNTTNLTAAERSAYALYESVLQVAESAIHATSCSPAVYDIDVYADGTVKNPSYNFVTVSTADGTPEFTLGASLSAPVAGRGQQIAISLVGSGAYLGSTGISTFKSTLAYNSVNNLLVSLSTNIGVVGINGGLPDNYSGNVIKDFYRGDDSNSSDPQYYNIYDWGLQAISKLGYPVEKWWQRSESHRSDGAIGRTVFVKDRLVGNTPCRIVIDTQGTNEGTSKSSLFWEGSSQVAGTLTITTNVPSDPVVPDASGVEAWGQSPFVSAP
jgi:hypothetical protein